MNKLNRHKKVQVIAALVEGVGVNATSRMTGVAKNTILKLLADVGRACAEYQDRTLRNLTCRRLQADECRQFCYAESKNVPTDERGQFGYGDVWTWTAIDADTKLAPCFPVGKSDAVSARIFIDDLAGRLKNRRVAHTSRFVGCVRSGKPVHRQERGIDETVEPPGHLPIVIL